METKFILKILLKTILPGATGVHICKNIAGGCDTMATAFGAEYAHNKYFHSACWRWGPIAD